jgi:hypothetical protein
MIVGAALIEIHVHGSQSLKQKRGVVQSIKQRVRNRFNVAVAEVGGQDTWQYAQIALSAVGEDATRVRGVLQRAAEFVESLGLAEVSGVEIAIEELPHEPPSGELLAEDIDVPWSDDE